MHLLKHVAYQVVEVGSLAAKEGSKDLVRVEVLSIEASVLAAPSESFLRAESVVARPALRVAQASVSLAQLLERLSRRRRPIPIWVQLQGNLGAVMRH